MTEFQRFPLKYTELNVKFTVKKKTQMSLHFSAGFFLYDLAQYKSGHVAFCSLLFSLFFAIHQSPDKVMFLYFILDSYSKPNS